MPAAKLTLDFDTRKFFTGDGTAVTAMSGKKNSIREYELSIKQNDVTLSLPTGTTMKAALKKPAAEAGTLLVEAEAHLAGWGTGTRWFFVLDLTGEAFTPVLNTNVDFDIMILIPDTPTDQVFMSLTIPFKVEKPVQDPSP